MRRLRIAALATGLALFSAPALAQDHGGAHGGPRPAASAPAHGAPAHGAPDHGKGEHAEGEQHAAGGHHDDGPPEMNVADFSKKDAEGKPIPPLVALFGNFVVLLLIYYFAGRRAVAKALKDRRHDVAKEIEEAQRMKTAAEERKKTYDAKLARLNEELEQAKQALIEAGKGERDRIIKEAEEKAARMQKDAAFLVEQELKQIRQDLWRETVEVAVTSAEELLKKRITPADQERLAEDYLSDLAAQHKRTTGASVAPPKGGAS